MTDARPRADRPASRLSRRLLDALLWAVVAAIVAPLTFAGTVAGVMFIRNVEAPVLGVFLYFASFALFASLVFGLAPYAAMLVGWALLAPHFGDVDRSRARLALAMAGLAVPAAGVVMVRSDASIATFAWIWLVAWAGLLVPRLVVPRLSPGAFATPPTS